MLLEWKLARSSVPRMPAGRYHKRPALPVPRRLLPCARLIAAMAAVDSLKQHADIENLIARGGPYQGDAFTPDTPEDRAPHPPILHL